MQCNQIRVRTHTHTHTHTHTAGKLVLEQEEVEDLVANHLAPLAHLMPLSQVPVRCLWLFLLCMRMCVVYRLCMREPECCV